MSNDKYKLILLHTNSLNLYLEKILIDRLYGNISTSTFSFNFICDNSDDFIYDPKNFIIFHHNLSTLLRYKNLGCWTVYMTHLIFTNNNNNPIIHEQLLQNIKLLKENHKFFNFSVHFFFQLKNYFKVINQLKSVIKLNYYLNLIQIFYGLKKFRYPYPMIPTQDTQN